MDAPRFWRVHRKLWQGKRTLLIWLLQFIVGLYMLMGVALRREAGPSTPQPQLYLPTLRPDQARIVRDPAKTKVLSMGRRWGKTVMGWAVAVACASQGGRVAWVVPTYRNGRPLWRLASASVADLRKAGLVRVDQTERTIEFHQSRGFLGIYSADNEDSIRGEDFDLVIIDEAARVSETIWSDVIQPTLADRGGMAILISTPKGKGNWFHREFLRGSDPKNYTEVRSWTAPSSDNPMPSIKLAMEKARERVSKRTFEQEWMALFKDSGGEVFSRVREAATGVWQAQPVQAHLYNIGCDWGRWNDATVFAIIDVTLKAVVRLDILRVEYGEQVEALVTLDALFRPMTILAESNSIGGVVIEELQKRGLPVQGFQTTNATKNTVVEKLVVAFENGGIIIPALDSHPNAETFINELEAYESSQSPSGLTRYSAPTGMHDDTVIGACLGWYVTHNSKRPDMRQAHVAGRPAAARPETSIRTGRSRRTGRIRGRSIPTRRTGFSR